MISHSHLISYFHLLSHSHLINYSHLISPIRIPTYSFTVINTFYFIHSIQAGHLKKLEIDNQEEAQRLEQTVKKGEKLLEQIQASLQDIGKKSKRDSLD